MFQTKKEVVEEYKVLKRKPNSEEGLNILKKLVAQVKPIITKRGWHVRYLCEFFPKNPNLLGCNVNRGFKINLRLRPHYDDSIFLEYNDILGTLLHELAHIVRGSHDEIFYKLLNELKEETEILMASGYSGDGFYSNGQRLGSTSLSVPLYQSSHAAAAAAEKRRQLDKIMLPKGGVRLGQGTPPRSPTALLTPAQMAASAAERRLRDQVWCGGSILIQDDDDDDGGDRMEQQAKRTHENQSGSPSSSSLSNKRVKQTDPTSSLENISMKEPESFIDLTTDNEFTGDEKEEQEWIQEFELIKQEEESKSKKGKDKEDEQKQQGDEDGWVCSKCTFLNGSIVLVCAMCLSVRPMEKEEGEQVDGNDSWLCPQCTLNNDKKWSVCNACQYVYLN